MNHTPGPWTVASFVGAENPTTGAGLYEVEEADKQVLDLFSQGRHKEAHAVGESNRRLIAAAPELLAACESALSDLEDCWKNGVKKGYQRQRILSLPSLRAAIAKAKGGA